MFDRLYASLVKNCLVNGINHDLGWGREVRKNVLPLLDHPKLRHHRNIILEGLDRSEDPISVFVVGEGKYGKSTLINALVGEEIAAVHYLPKTWHITRYTSVGNEKRYELHYESTASSATRFEEDCMRLGRGPRILNGIVKFSSEKELDALIKHEDKVHDQRKESPIWQVVKPLPKERVGRLNLEIVDTPGIKQHRSTSVKEESLDDFYHRADVVLWLVVSDKINSRESRGSMKAMSRYGKPIVLVVNRADKIPEKKRASVMSDAKRAYGDLVADIILVSAKNAFEARKKGNEKQFETSGLDGLESRMEDLVGLKGAETKALSLLSTSRQAARECGEILRQEADTMEENIWLFDENISTAEGFKKPGMNMSNQGLSGLSEAVGNTAAISMSQNPRVSAHYSGKPFDESLVKADIQAVVEEYSSRISYQLQRHLSSIQDEVVARPYYDQIYGADATVKSQETRISFEIGIDEIGSSIDMSSIRPEYDFMDKIEDIAGEVFDFVAGFIGAARTASQKKEAKRRRDLEKYIEASHKLGPKCRDSLKRAIQRGIEQTQTALAKEVERCFSRSFTSRGAATEKIKDLLSRAERAVIPPPILFTATRMLRKALS